MKTKSMLFAALLVVVALSNSICFAPGPPIPPGSVIGAFLIAPITGITGLVLGAIKGWTLFEQYGTTIGIELGGPIGTPLGRIIGAVSVGGVGGAVGTIAGGAVAYAVFEALGGLQNKIRRYQAEQEYQRYQAEQKYQAEMRQRAQKLKDQNSIQETNEEKS